MKSNAPHSTFTCANKPAHRGLITDHQGSGSLTCSKQLSKHSIGGGVVPVIPGNAPQSPDRVITDGLMTLPSHTKAESPLSAVRSFCV